MPDKNELTVYQAASIAAYVEIVEQCAKEWFTTESTWGRGFAGNPMLSGAFNPACIDTLL
jgi:hypothetical protein